MLDHMLDLKTGRSFSVDRITGHSEFSLEWSMDIQLRLKFRFGTFIDRFGKKKQTKGRIGYFKQHAVINFIEVDYTEVSGRKVFSLVEQIDSS